MLAAPARQIGLSLTMPGPPLSTLEWLSPLSSLSKSRAAEWLACLPDASNHETNAARLDLGGLPRVTSPTMPVTTTMPTRTALMSRRRCDNVIAARGGGDTAEL